MPRREAIDLMNTLMAEPQRAKDVNWGLFISENPDLNLEKIRRDFGEHLPEAPAEADVNFLLSHPLHRPRELTATRWVGDKLQQGWDWYMNQIAEQGKLAFVTPEQLERKLGAGEDVSGKMIAPPTGEVSRIAANIGLGGIKAFAALPAFAGEVAGVAQPTITEGDIGETIGRGRTMLEEFVDPAAKAAALATSRIESRQRPPTEVERQFYEDVTGEEAFGVIAPGLAAFGGPKMVKAGFKYVRGAGRQILSRNFQKIAPLEGLEGDFVRLGDKPANRKLYHKDPVEGWREFRSKKKAKGDLVDALDQYIESVTPRQFPFMVDQPLPKAVPLLARPKQFAGSDILPSTKKSTEPFGGKIPFKAPTGNTYLRMPIERVRKDAELGVRAAKDALRVRQHETARQPAPRVIEPEPGRALEAETPLAGRPREIPTIERETPLPGRGREISDIIINPEVDKMLGRSASKNAAEFIKDVTGDRQAGFVRLPERETLKRGFRTIGKVTSLGEVMARPSVKLQRSAPGRKMIQRVIKAETTERTIRANAEIIMDNAINKKYPSGKITSKDRAWMKDNFKSFYEDGKSMPNERIQGFANAWTQTADRMGRLAEKVGVKIRGKEFKPRQNYFPNILTEKGRLALEAKGGNIWDAILADLEKRGKTTEGIKTLVKELSPTEEAKAVKRVGSLEHPRLLELPEEVTFTNEFGRKQTVKILETDPFEVIPSYITRSSRRMGIIKSFGQGTETFEALLKEAGENVEARKAITNAWNDVQRFAHRPSAEIGTIMKGVRPIENITRASLLSLAQLANVPGEIATIYKAGLKNSGRAFIDSFRKSKTAKFDFDRKLGAWSNDVLRDLQTTEDLTGKTGKFARKAMKLYGFEGINRHINKVGARAMQLTIEDLFEVLRKGESSTFQRITGRSQSAVMRQLQRDFFWTTEDIARIKTSGLSTTDKARVAQRAPALINVIGESALDRPSWIRHPVMQRFMSYTSFGRAMGNIMADTLKETKNGNFFPLARFLAGQQLAGELEIWLKNFVLNKERTDKGWTDRLINNYLGSMTLGVWGIGYEKLQWLRGGNPVEAMAPPNIEVPIELANEMRKAIAKGELPDAFRAVAERIPIWRAGAVTAERIIDPESAEARKKERTQRIMAPDFNERFFQALKKRNKAIDDKDRVAEEKFEAEMESIRKEAGERSVTLSEQSIRSKMGEEIKKGNKKIDIFGTLGAGRKK